jgi:hypothetical protein
LQWCKGYHYSNSKEVSKQIDRRLHAKREKGKIDQKYTGHVKGGERWIDKREGGGGGVEIWPCQRPEEGAERKTQSSAQSSWRPANISRYANYNLRKV